MSQTLNTQDEGRSLVGAGSPLRQSASDNHAALQSQQHMTLEEELRSLSQGMEDGGTYADQPYQQHLSQTSSEERRERISQEIDNVRSNLK